jgi:hypothetical protein
MPSFSNLGDEPGKTDHGGHSGMDMAVHGKRKGGGKADEDEMREHEATGGTTAPKLAKGGRAPRAMGGNSTDGSTNRPVKGNAYNAVGSPEMAEAQDETPGFHKGGKAKRKSGGTSEGETEMRRHDRHARGGAAKSPYSTGASLSQPSDDRQGRGYEGGKAA